MTGNKFFDCTEMFRHACSFANYAELGRAQDDRIDFAKPEIVNSALACEIFLKAICFYYDINLNPLFTKKRGHNLKALYEVIPQNIKDYIKQSVSQGYRNMWLNPFGIEYLSEISDAFEKWRYSYEHKSLHMPTWFLNRFRDALREACCQMFFKITWDEYKGR